MSQLQLFRTVDQDVTRDVIKSIRTAFHAARLQMIRRVRLWISLCLSAWLLAGCLASAPPIATQRNDLGDLASVSESLGKDLAQQLAASRNSLLAGKQTVSVDRFVDIQTGQVNQISRRMADQMSLAMGRSLKDIAFRSLEGKGAAAADYVLTGSVGLENYVDGSRQYRVYASITELKSGMVVANARGWLRSSPELDVLPEAAYGDAPMLLADRTTAAQITTTKTLPGAAADPLYLSQLTTSALLNGAEAALSKNELNAALQMYAEAASRSDGQLMRTYSGLYLVQTKLGNDTEAEKAFSELFTIGLGSQQVSVRFLFRVASTAFLDDVQHTGRYTMWLRQIARQTAAKRACLEIAGHTSRSGKDSFNEKLSLQRAETIAKALVQSEVSLTNRLKAVGKGSRENIVGTGSDDGRDAVDRRVEFKVIACQ